MGEISPPWESIKDIIDEAHMNETVFASLVGLTGKGLQRLKAGEMEIQPLFAKALSSALGSSQQFWLNREIQYRAARNRRDAENIATLERRLKKRDRAVDRLAEEKQKLEGQLAEAQAPQLQLLRDTNVERAKAWNENHPEDHNEVAEILFRSNELGGECGELQNVVKKLARIKLNMPTGNVSVEDLEDEAGDVLICLDRVCEAFGIDLWQAAVSKFNKTSDKHGFTVYLPDTSAPKDSAPKTGFQLALDKAEEGMSVVKGAGERWNDSAPGREG